MPGQGAMVSQERLFVYDPPKPDRMCLFHLNLEDSNESRLSGRLLSFTSIADTNPAKVLKKMLTQVWWTWDEAETTILKKMSGMSEFVALSYSWGSASERYPLHMSTINVRTGLDDAIEMDHETNRNGVIWITKNLHDFLHEMRRQKFLQFLWIDAICIDQNNEQDKRLQIPMMKSFYDDAAYTLVWLGSATEAEEEALLQMPEVTENLLLLPEGHRGLDKDLEWEFMEAGLPFPADTTWRIYRNMLTREWWSRLWTLQEVVIARPLEGSKLDDYYYRPPRARLMLGKASLQWSDLNQFAQALGRKGLRRWLITGSLYFVPEHLHGLDAIDEVNTCIEGSFWSIPLPALLAATRRRESTVPADMVHGMSALLHESTSKKLDIEVSMSAREIFIKFGKHYIRHAPKECLLNHAVTKMRHPLLPSWCPNFASRPETRSIGTHWISHFHEVKHIREQMFCAGFQYKGKWEIPRSKLFYLKYAARTVTFGDQFRSAYDTDDRRQIAVMANSDCIVGTGMVFDTVSEIVERNPGVESADFFTLDALRQTASWDKTCFALAKRCLPETAGSTNYNIYARTLTANRVSVDPVSEDGTIFDNQGQVDFEQVYLNFRRLMLEVLDEGIDHDPRLLFDREARWFLECMGLMTRRRRFFCTKGGRIGIGPSNTQVGDRLVVLFYCPTPYLLRLVQEYPHYQWQFVGETFVHGLMYGEALKMFDEGKVKQNKFVIR